MENLLFGANNNERSLTEYFLRGSVSKARTMDLLHHLYVLCDTSRANLGWPIYIDHEIVYSLSSPGVAPVTLQVSRAVHCPDLDLDTHSDTVMSDHDADERWHLRYVGKTCHSLATMTRSRLDIATSPNVTKFLEELGFKLDFEYLSRGRVLNKGRMKIATREILRMQKPGDVDNTEAIGNHTLVELSVLASQGEDHIAEEMRAFADGLKPMVQLEKVDVSALKAE